jgi:formylglycine-generating enzyme required for sulfatase activity
LKPKDTFKDCPECPEMVVIPSGSYMMGSPTTEKGREDREGPQHKVTIARPVAAGKFEATFAEWDACVAAGGCKHSPDDLGSGRGKQPVVMVNWDDNHQGVPPVAFAKDGQHVSAADRGGMGVRGTGRHGDAVLDRTDHHA